MTSNFTLPEDVYLLRIVGAKKEHSETTGRTYIQLTLWVAVGPYTGQLVYKPILDSLQAAWVWKDIIEEDEKDCEFTPDLFINKYVIAKTRVDVYQGQGRTAVEQLFPAPVALVRRVCNVAKALVP